jgi:outer membrane receptor for ferrienterochelin and colicins
MSSALPACPLSPAGSTSPSSRRRHPPLRRPTAVAALLLGCLTGLHPVSARAQAADATAVVVVSAARQRMLAVDAPASVSVVTQQEIAARGADSVLDAVRLESGLSLQGRAVGGRQVLGQRGMDARHTLLLVDGQRSTASDGVVGASDFQYDWLSGTDIERIEVVRGPLSVLYGSEALGGVVNLITRVPGERWRFGALAEHNDAAGSRGGDGWRSSISADGPLGGGLAVRAGAAVRRQQALASVADPRISELEGRDKQSAWLALHWQGAGHALRLEHRHGDETRDADARERSGRRRLHHTVNTIDRRSTSMRWDAETLHLPGLDAPAQLQWRAYRTGLDVANWRSNGVPANPTQQLTDTVVDGQLQATLGRHALLAGLEVRNEALDDSALPGGQATASHRALFVQDVWTPATGWTLTTGLRLDRHGLFGSHWSPRAYLVWRASPAWTVKGGYSHGFSAPNLKQTAPGPRAEGPNTVIGNPDLQPEVADSLELAVSHAAGARQVQLVAFGQRVRDLIELRLVAPGAVPGIGTYAYRNQAQARVTGLELNWAEPLARWAALRLAATTLDARDGHGQRLERRPRHSASLRLDAWHGAWRAGWDVSVTGRQLLAASAVGAPPVSVPGYTLQGAHLTRSLPAGLALTLGVRNLGNLRLAERSPLFTQVEPPRTWRVALQGSW